MESAPSASNSLPDFLEFLYGGLNGIAYVATKDPANPLEWGQHFFQYPAESSRMEQVILQSSSTLEVYVSPALYSAPDAKKENFRVSNVVWTEFDGNAPTLDAYETPPSLRIQSSGEQNQHIYWRLTEPIYDVNRLEQINRNITYSMSADTSAWDATQVLRPPNTTNHKRNSYVSVLDNAHVAYDVGIFDVLPTAPEQIDVGSWELGVLPNVQDVILKYPFPPDMALLLTKEKAEVKDRSASLMNLAYGACEMGMSDAEVFVVLKLADDRWGKFKERTDRNKRLAHIITVARHKHPAMDSEDYEPFAFALDFLTFLNTDVEIDYVVEPMLMENGSMLMVGPSGIGKTQISLQFMIHLALGKDYWHYKINKPRKILFLSLEMGFGELKKFVASMAKSLQPEDYTKLAENLILVPHGEKWALNTPVGQQHLTQMIEDYRPDGIFIDSIGSAIAGSINDDEAVMGYLDFVDRIRKKYDLFTWAIHHMRKATNGGHAPTGQDDVYGNQYLVNRSTSAYGILRGRDGLIKIRTFKNRLSEKEEDFYVKREENLTFSRLNQDITEKVQHIEYKKPESEKGPAPETHNGFDL